MTGNISLFLATHHCSSVIFLKFGSHLLSHAVTSIVPSAAWVLTIVFGMGTGVSPRRIATGNFANSVVSADFIMDLLGKLACLANIW